MARESEMPAVQNSDEQLTYGLRGNIRRLIFDAKVLVHFERNRQRGWLATEAGGQLFARFNADEITVEVATGPYRRDKRSRFLFTPDRRQEQRDIDAYFKRRLHFIGNWHTHPQGVPEPSSVDAENTRQRFIESEHSLAGFLMVIVGLNSFPSGLYVALVDNKKVKPLPLLRPSQKGRGD